MAKAKFDPKDFLLRKGEVLAMGASGFILAVLLVYGATKWSSAQNPDETASKLKRQSQDVHTRIQTGAPSDGDLEQLKLPPWITTQPSFATPKVPEFTQTGQLFDPTAQPNTKRENPTVFGIGEYQVDLTRSAMLGYDIIYDAGGEALIAVLTTKVDKKYDDKAVKAAAADLKLAAQKGKRRPVAKQPPKLPMGPMGPMDVNMFPGGETGPHGLTGGGFDLSAQRNEKAIQYIPLGEIDKSVKEGKLPAFTVIPLRLVTVHAVVPYKKQLDELKRALRLPVPIPIPVTGPDGRVVNRNQAEIDAAEAEARKWGPWYDGFEVQRRATKVLPNGTVQVIQEWPDKPADPKDTSGNYPFEEKYIERIDTRKIADHFDEGYIPYFLKPEMMLAMPLPQLAKDLNVQYPKIELKDIKDNEEKLRKAFQQPLSPSDLLQQIKGIKPGRSIYKLKTAEALSGLGYDPKMYGPVSGPGMGMGPGPGPMGPMGPMGPGGAVGPPGALARGTGTPQYPEGYGPTGSQVVNEVDNFLLRFVDCDVTPGYTYEYRIRLKMWNPNYNQKDLVANPEFAKESWKTLYSKWLQLETPITVPAESFLYAHDVKAYRDKIDEAYPRDSKEPETKAINSLLQVKDNQAVVQVATWMEQVLTEGNKREPVGAWVVAEMPVGRGEYVGRKQLIKLPLWSSETQQYLLREVGDKVLFDRFGKPLAQPKGWLVNFSTKSVLVDFEGGKVKTRANVRFDEKGMAVPGGRPIDEDAATEMLIVRPDGKLVVRNSAADDADAVRKPIVAEWARWVKEIETRRAPGAMGGEANPFDPRKGP